MKNIHNEIEIILQKYNVENCGINFYKKGEYVDGYDPIKSIEDKNKNIKIDNGFNIYYINKLKYDDFKIYPVCPHCGRDYTDFDCGNYECEVIREKNEY